VNEIAVSPHDAGTLFVSFRKDRVGDNTPHVFMSADYGATWTRLVNGLRDGEPVRVVREDPERRGLLYAGTETGVYVSFDRGARWQPFAGFPVTPVTDLAVKHDDLIASTEGRSFWILDDLSVLRQHSAEVARAAAHLYAPRRAILLAGGGGFGGGGGGTRVGRNPPTGGTVHFRLAAAPDSSTKVSLEFLDARGVVLRTYSDRSGAGPARLAARAGLNTFTWDLRREAPTTLQGVQLFGAPSGGGAKVLPGRYQVRLTVGAFAQTQPFDVVNDPRLEPIPAAVIAERDSIANLLVARIGEIHDAVLRVRDVRAQVAGIVTRTATDPMADSIAAEGKKLTTKAESLDPRMTTKAGNGQDIINYANGINGQFGFLLGQVEGNPGLTAQIRERLAELERMWGALRAEVEVLETTDVERFNQLLERAKVPGLITPKPKPRVVM
jgi:hypothetical protein